MKFWGAPEKFAEMRNFRDFVSITMRKISWFMKFHAACKKVRLARNFTRTKFHAMRFIGIAFAMRFIGIAFACYIRTLCALYASSNAIYRKSLRCQRLRNECATISKFRTKYRFCCCARCACRVSLRTLIDRLHDANERNQRKRNVCVSYVKHVVLSISKHVQRVA